VVSTHRTEYPKPGKPVFHPASIHEDLRRRDFTANAMAISLNEGSFGLLMDPMNGAADIEARTLRLVSNYGFLEEPSLLIRATRYLARLGWELDPKTKTRYDNAKAEGVIEYLSTTTRNEELEQIGHEEEGLKILRALEAEGWMSVLFPAWTAAKADEEKLSALHALAVELLLQGVHADMSAAQMQLLTAKLSSKDLAALKKSMLRPGFVEEWNSLDSLATVFAKVLLAKENATPSTSYKLFTTYDPEAILWLGFTTKDPAVKERFDLFLKVWPEARQRIPHALMQEMRVTPELATYREIVQAIFLELIDGRLTTPEEIRAFLEPHSPPAPPPQVTIKRPRAKRGAEAKIKEPSYDDDEDAEVDLDADDDLDDIVADDEEDMGLGLALPKVDLDTENSDEVEPVGADLDSDLDADDEDGDDEPEPTAPPSKRGPKAPAAPKPSPKAAKAPAVPAPKPAVSTAQHTPVVHAKSKPAPAPKHAPAPVASKEKKQAKHAHATPAPRHSAPKPPPKPAPKAPSKPAAKSAIKKPLVKPLRKPAPSKSAPVKSKAKAAPVSSKSAKPSHSAKASRPAVKKPAPKPAKKR
jgi:tRNA nucleotidyltransferase/poly(A) polymerase